MAQPLLATKLYLPLPRPDTINRPRLLELLDQAHTRKLTLVSAPPGFGKTSLLVNWKALRPFPLGWVSLDEADNEPGRFWTYFLAAVQRVHPTLGQPALSALQTATSDPIPAEGLLTSLINEVTQLALENTFGVVFDDYHVIHNQAIHQGLAFLLEHLPPQMRLFITSRADPLGLPLSRMRVRGELAEIRSAQLRFTLEEAAAFFNSKTGLALSSQDVEQLANRTEGWVAGLQLAALSLQDFTPEEAHRFVESFAGNDRYVVDYLLEEVLNRQSTGVQTFLLQTSVLDRLSGPLCRAVTSLDDAAEILARLEQSNLFVISLDSRREWFRYHHLFAELLRHHLTQSYNQGQVNELNRRAARWFEQNGQTAEAIRYALAGQDFEQASTLLEQTAQEMIVRADLIPLRTWLEALPEGIVRERPLLAISYCWTLLLTGQREKVAAYAEAAVAGPDQSDATKAFVLSNLAVIRTHLDFQSGNLDRTLEMAQEAFELLSPATYSAGSSLALILARAYLQKNRAAEAEQTFQKAVDLGRLANNQYTTITGLVGLSDIKFMRGRLHEAARLCRQAIEMGKSSSSAKPLPVTSEAYSHLAEILLEWNRLDEAERSLEQGREFSPLLTNQRITLFELLLLARLQFSRGRFEAASHTQAEVEKFGERHGLAEIKPLIASYRAWLWLREGKINAAREWARQQAEKKLPNLAVRFFWQESTVLVRTWLTLGEFEQATQMLAELQRQAQGWTGYLIEIQMLQALAWSGAGNRAKALNILAATLTLAEPEGYTRLFIEEGPPMAALLGQLAGSPNHSFPKEYLQTLLASFEGVNAAALPPMIAPSLEFQKAQAQVPGQGQPSQTLSGSGAYTQFIERPSERELEVLRLIAAGLSNQEISERLVVSPNTVKAHINKIYGKLDVSSRTQAINRARELDLL